MMTTPPTPYEHMMPLMEHLLELRRRLIFTVIGFGAAFGISYLFAEEIFGFLARPLAQALNHEAGRRLIYTGLAEAFLSYVKVAMFAAAFISFPVLASQIWLFIAPGLYAQEKKAFLPFLIATPFLFLSGAAFAYYAIIPNAWHFFLQFESLGTINNLPIQLEARMGEYLSIVMQMLLAFGICFELPVLLVLLAKIGVVSGQMLQQKRKYAFLLILIVSALLTPPDMLSMIGLANPLYGLYELSVMLVKVMEKRQTKGEDRAGFKVDS
jgi:sec-independent protein translocase protein TatC